MARTWERIIRGLGVLTIIGFFLAGMTPVSNILGRKLAIPESVMQSDAIVVLGAGFIHTGTLREESMRRIVRAVELHKQGLAPLLVVLGNSSEIAGRSRLARAMGVPPDAVITLETTTTTREESTRTAGLLRQRNARRIILVTESLHMRRAKLLFERAGLEVRPAVSSDYLAGMIFPGDRLWLSMRVAQEYAAFIYYRLAGYI